MFGCPCFCHQFTVTLSQILSFSGPPDPHPPTPAAAPAYLQCPPTPPPASCIVTKVSDPGRQRKVLTKPVTHPRPQTVCMQ